MKAKYQYRTAETKQDPDAVEAVLNTMQEDGWEYVSGPVQTHGGYLFLMRRATAGRMTISLSEIGIAEDPDPNPAASMNF